MRYKRVIGGRLLGRDPGAQLIEARLACDILNRMAELGMPASRAVRTRIDAFDAALWRELDSCTNAPPTCSNAELPDAACRSARNLNQLLCTVIRSCPGARRSDEYSPE